MNLRATSFAKIVANLPNDIMASEYSSTPLFQIPLSLSTDKIKDSYQHIGKKMGELPDLKKRTVEEAILQRWGERVCVVRNDVIVS